MAVCVLKITGEQGYDASGVKDIIVSIMAGLLIFSCLSVVAVWIQVVQSPLPSSTRFVFAHIPVALSA